MQIRVTKIKRNKYKDDQGNTFASLDEMLAFHGIIYTKNDTKPTTNPHQFVYIDTNGKETTIN